MKYLTKYYHLLFFYFSLIFIAGCSSNEKELEVKVYSDDTNHAFEMIERGGSYYLKNMPNNSLAPPQLRPVQKVLKRQKITDKNSITETLMPANQEAVQEDIVIDKKIHDQDDDQPSPLSLTKSQPHTKTEERLIEINQNLAFYCMKHRKDPRFSGNESRCMKYVSNAMNDCQKIHRIVNSKLLGCIQKKLKR